MTTCSDGIVERKYQLSAIHLEDGMWCAATLLDDWSSGKNNKAKEWDREETAHHARKGPSARYE